MTEHTGFSGYPHHTPAMRRIMHRKFALRAGGAVLWFLAWTLFCFFWGADHNEYFSRFNWTLLGVLIGLLGWRIFRIGAILRDRPFEGVITDIQLKYVYHSDTPWLKAAPRQVPQVVAEIAVDGRESVRYHFPVKDPHPKQYYAVGDRVRHYRGLPYPEKSYKPEDTVICAACGRFSYVRHDRCEFCKMPLLKSETTLGEQIMNNQAKDQILHDDAFTTIAKLEGIESCRSTQGLGVGETYLYSIQIKSDNSRAIIHRIHKETGEECRMIDGATGSEIFYNLRHANSADLLVRGGKEYFYISVSDKIFVYEIDDRTLNLWAEYDLTLDGKPYIAVALTFYRITDREITFLFKNGRTVTCGSIGIDDKTGVIPLTVKCTLDVTRVPLNGEEHDFTPYLNQSFYYHDEIVYLIITGNHSDPTINHSILIGYNVEEAEGNALIQPIPDCVLYLISDKYPGLFEVEDCGVSTDGKMYFNSNGWLVKWGDDHDGVHVFNDLTFTVRNFRFPETMK